MQKPPSKIPTKPKLIHIDRSEFKLIERAAKSTRPRALTVSYYIAQAAVSQARRDLNLPALLVPFS